MYVCMHACVIKTCLRPHLERDRVDRRVVDLAEEAGHRKAAVNPLAAVRQDAHDGTVSLSSASVCVYMRLYACTCACIHACMNVRACVCMHACTHACTAVRIHDPKQRA